MKKINVFGKQIPVLIVIGLLFAGLGSAALLTFYGTITTTVDVDQAITLTGGDCTGNSCADSPTGVYSGDTVFSNLFTLTNLASTPRDVQLTTEYNPTIVTGEIVTKYLEYFDDAGIQDYNVPGCDITVTGGNSITTAITGAVDGNVICVETGNYDGFIVNKPLTLVASGDVTVNTNGPSSASGMIQVASDDVTIEGFIVDSDTKNYAVELGISYTGIVLRNNEFIGNTHGLYINPTSAGPLVENNKFDVLGVAIGSDGHLGTIIKQNVFTNNIAAEVMGASGTYTVTFTENNIFTDAPLADYSGAGFDASDNYFAEGIHTVGTVTADWMTKTDFSLVGGEVDGFITSNYFNTDGFDGTITTTITP